jgi:hypothetical protein
MYQRAAVTVPHAPRRYPGVCRPGLHRATDPGHGPEYRTLGEFCSRENEASGADTRMAAKAD